MEIEQRFRKYLSNLIISTLFGSFGTLLIVVLLVLLVIPIFYITSRSPNYEDDYDYTKYIDTFIKYKNEYNVGVDITLLMAIESVYPDFYGPEGNYNLNVIETLAGKMIEEKSESHILEYSESSSTSEEVILNNSPSADSSTTSEAIKFYEESVCIKEMIGTKITTVNTSYSFVEDQSYNECFGLGQCTTINKYLYSKTTTVTEDYVENWIITYYHYTEDKFYEYIKEEFEMKEDDLKMVVEMSGINKELTGFTNKGLIPWFMYPSPIERLPLNELDKTSEFGFRLDPITNDFAFHNGVDYSASVGSNIYATSDGEVMELGTGEITGNYYVISSVLNSY